MRKRFFSVWLALLLSAALSAFGAQSACPQHYPNAIAPDLTQGTVQKAREICNEAFVTVHSGLTRTPLWSAQRLTTSSVRSAKSQFREDVFHPDGRLPPDERAEMRDYAGSGFDRGHIAPSGDMPNRFAQEQSFALSNMVPQNPEMNRGLWADIEGAVRNMAIDKGELFVMTGPVYQNFPYNRLRGKVAIPDQLFKLVYDPKANQAGVYLARNDNSGAYQIVSVERLKQLIGVDLMPTLPEQAKDHAMALPTPVSRYARNGQYKQRDAANDAAYNAAKEAKRVANHLLRIMH